MNAKSLIRPALGLVLGLLIGFGCRAWSIPLPAPPVLIGALLVIAMTLGHETADRLLARRAGKSSGGES